jgi:superfamily II DNA/RNA helicase
VLVPTKELVHQVDGVCKVLNESGGIMFRTKALLHSEEGSITSHLKQKHQIDVGIGTPQLVCNLIAKKLLKTNCIQAVVLDEADTLLDDSFVTAVNYILSRTKIRGYDASKCQEQFEIEDTDEEDSQDNKSAHTGLK